MKTNGMSDRMLEGVNLFWIDPRKRLLGWLVDAHAPNSMLFWDSWKHTYFSTGLGRARKRSRCLIASTSNHCSPSHGRHHFASCVTEMSWRCCSLQRDDDCTYSSASVIWVLFWAKFQIIALKYFGNECADNAIIGKKMEQVCSYLPRRELLAQ